MSRPASRVLLRLVLTAAATLAAATLVTWVLETFVGVPDASAVYLVAVVITAFVSGTPGAITAAFGSFLLYNYFFTEPRGTLTVGDPGIWLNVVLLLFVGIVVGQLAALQRSRAAEARAREQEARALFRLSRLLAARDDATAAAAGIATVLQEESPATRVWISLGSDDASERLAADSLARAEAVVPAIVNQLAGSSVDEAPRWVRIHQARTGRRSSGSPEAYRVRMTADDRGLGSIWWLRERGEGTPDRLETRLFATAADQLGQALEHDRLAAESQAAEIARQSDELKSALLESVSHDLRTPLATIRAAAGALHPSSGLGPDEQAHAADAIDREVAYLDRLVTNLLDLSRIEAGVLRAEREPYELEDLVSQALERLRSRLGSRALAVEVAAPPVDVDPTFISEALANVIENAIKYAPPDAPIRVAATELDADRVRLSVEDGGPGVPDETLPRLFEKFYRVPSRARGSRAGTGVGLAVVRGLVEATGGHVAARRSDLGGLAIDMDLPRARPPTDRAGVPTP